MGDAPSTTGPLDRDSPPMRVTSPRFSPMRALLLALAVCSPACPGNAGFDFIEAHGTLADGTPSTAATSPRRARAQPAPAARLRRSPSARPSTGREDLRGFRIEWQHASSRPARRIPPTPTGRSSSTFSSTRPTPAPSTRTPGGQRRPHQLHPWYRRNKITGNLVQPRAHARRRHRRHRRRRLVPGDPTLMMLLETFPVGSFQCNCSVARLRRHQGGDRRRSGRRARCASSRSCATTI